VQIRRHKSPTLRNCDVTGADRGVKSVPPPGLLGAYIPRSNQIKDWSPTPEAFRQFLHWLDEGLDSGGEKYLEMRRRLVSYFDRKNCACPDELTDETLNRVARRLEEEGSITDITPARYCYIVAKFVFLEYLRQPKSSEADIDGLVAPDHRASALRIDSGPDVEREGLEKLLHCLDRCLQKLDFDERDLILEYYRGEQRAKIERRRDLATRLGLTMNAISIRACRIRNKLELCVRKCAA
jgi:DNA-directed RNA polymerase specialized sigma24 family protein